MTEPTHFDWDNLTNPSACAVRAASLALVMMADKIDSEKVFELVHHKGKIIDIDDLRTFVELSPPTDQLCGLLHEMVGILNSYLRSNAAAPEHRGRTHLQLEAQGRVVLARDPDQADKAHIAILHTGRYSLRFRELTMMTIA